MILLGESSLDTVKGSFLRWRDVAATQDKLVANRFVELKQPNATPNLKHARLQAYDKRLETYANQHISGVLSAEEYWKQVIDAREERW